LEEKLRLGRIKIKHIRVGEIQQRKGLRRLRGRFNNKGTWRTRIWDPIWIGGVIFKKERFYKGKGLGIGLELGGLKKNLPFGGIY